MKYEPQPGTTPHNVATALAEVGYLNVVGPPKPHHPRHSRFSTPKGSVPIPVIHKAMLLSALALRGADARVRCEVHARASDHLLCPKYPVGALLAGIVQGCRR